MVGGRSQRSTIGAIERRSTTFLVARKPKLPRRRTTGNPRTRRRLNCSNASGSTELETLVGKLFEAKGCHVPAYLGGTLEDIDIFAWNDTATPISIKDIVIPAGSRISIQVKTWRKMECPSAVDYLIGLDAILGPKAFDAEWILARVRESPDVLAWLKRSLKWLPADFLKQFGL